MKTRGVNWLMVGVMAILGGVVGYQQNQLERCREARDAAQAETERMYVELRENQRDERARTLQRLRDSVTRRDGV